MGVAISHFNNKSFRGDPPMNYDPSWRLQWRVAISHFNRKSFHGDPPISKIIFFLGNFNPSNPPEYVRQTPPPEHPAKSTPPEHPAKAPLRTFLPSCKKKVISFAKYVFCLMISISCGVLLFWDPSRGSTQEP